MPRILKEKEQEDVDKSRPASRLATNRACQRYWGIMKRQKLNYLNLLRSAPHTLSLEDQLELKIDQAREEIYNAMESEALLMEIRDDIRRTATPNPIALTW